MIRRTVRDIRRRNRSDVLQCTYAAGHPVNRQQIAAATGLSTATVATLTGELLAAGVLHEVGQEDSRGGRPRARLSVNGARGLLIGTDVSEDFVHIALFDLAMRVRGTFERPLDPGGSSPLDVVELVALGVDEVLRDSGADRERVLGIGVSVPGLVEKEHGVSLLSVYGHWENVPLKALLAERLGFPLYLDNPLKASTVAELWFGAGRGVDNLVVVTLRTGVGVGMALDGALYRGVTNCAGEWGHTGLVRKGRGCRCGRLGCVEAYVSAPGILQTLREADPHSPLPALEDQRAAIAGLAEAVRRGEPAAVQALEDTGDHLGAAVSTLINTLNPRVLVLGDWTAQRLGEPLLDATRAAAARYALAQPFNAVSMQLCRLPHNPVSMGAAAFALEGFLADLASGAGRAGRGGARPVRG
ncbi:ROK family protein [Streptomyces physcomitrii]|uniref:ROK family protein n=1 Tax=Streptomyces physcomitrii TaxID=2724184 RepID=A0ABX1H9L7_9ACTN|nr:ROK family protein [Streptomyces physcomitrii]NKI43934.1 ROK family protein [Streptomyces physcomitrii]